MRVNPSPIREPQPQPKVKPKPKEVTLKEQPVKDIKPATPPRNNRVDLRA